ncbi:MAG TPA: fused MFS/spermidine synthase [Rhizomicrobium sp.]|nr:fused MFS/spermidine synthase [Rhizomicrobium sp.]
MTLAIDTPARSNVIFPRRSATALIYLFFFVSGMPALVYQLIWQRVLFRIFGVSMDSVTVVVTAFMLGLGIGSLFGSWLSSRKTLQPLLIIAAMEISIGLFGICSLPLFDYVDPMVQSLALVPRALVVIALIFVPTVLMGATLPVLVGHVVRRSANVGFSMGSLYRANALGAVAGCAVSALILFPFLGLQIALLIAAGLNVFVAVIAVAANYLERAEASAGAGTVPSPNGKALCAPISFHFALALVFLSGFVSLSFEIFLLHLVSFASGTNSLVFSLTLGAFLLGIASGAQATGEWCKNNAPGVPLSNGMIGLLLLHGIVGLAVLPVIALSAALGKGMLAIIALASFLIARSLAGTFSLIAHRLIPPDRDAGWQAGLLYLANIIGSAAGCLITGFILCDLLGIRALAVLLSGLGLAVTSWFVCHWSDRTKSRFVTISGILFAAMVMAVFQNPLSASVIEVMLFKREAAIRGPLVRVVENRNGIIAVDHAGAVFGGGVYDGRFNVDLVHDTNGIIRPYALSLFHPGPSEVFMIGLATGSWAQVIANNPDVRHLTIVEINPGYTQLVRERPEVRSLLANPKVEIVIDDAHRWLKRHPDRKFDAIVANATYHFRSNASNLLSVEFDRLIASHLNRRGIYFYNTTDSRRVQVTGCESFADGYRVFNHMLVSNQPIALDGERWKNILVSYRIDGHLVFDLARKRDADVIAKVLTLPGFARSVSRSPATEPLETCSSVLKRTSDANIITDDNMGTEWRYPLGFE